MSSRHYHVVLNAQSGTAAGKAITADAIAERFAAAGLDAVVDADIGRPLKERVAAAVSSKADTIVAAGGDGTVTALATALIDGSKTLALIPLGTANLLARDLAIPLGFGEAIAALPSMTERRIDVGEVNGRIFLHKVVLGFAPEVAAERETLRASAGLSARLAFLKFFLERLSTRRTLRLGLSIDGAPERSRRVRSLAIANNAYDEGFGRFFARDRLDRGHLSVYVVKRFGPADLVRLCAGMFVGRWRSDAALAIRQASDVAVTSGRPDLEAMIDGEVETFSLPLHFRIKPRSLSVLAPPRAAQ